MSKEMTGIFIPNAILLDRRLGSSEKIVLSEIHYLDGPRGCYATNPHIGAIAGLSKGQVSRIISKLKSLGHITREPAYNVAGRLMHSNIKLEEVERVSMELLKRYDAEMRTEQNADGANVVAQEGAGNEIWDDF